MAQIPIDFCGTIIRPLSHFYLQIEILSPIICSFIQEMKATVCDWNFIHGLKQRQFRKKLQSINSFTLKGKSIQKLKLVTTWLLNDPHKIFSNTQHISLISSHFIQRIKRSSPQKLITGLICTVLNRISAGC